MYLLPLLSVLNGFNLQIRIRSQNSCRSGSYCIPTKTTGWRSRVLRGRLLFWYWIRIYLSAAPSVASAGWSDSQDACRLVQAKLCLRRVVFIRRILIVCASLTLANSSHRPLHPSWIHHPWQWARFHEDYHAFAWSIWLWQMASMRLAPSYTEDRSMCQVCVNDWSPSIQSAS
jgi:hypothetical protein